MTLEELGRMSAKERLTWINTAKVQDLNTILKEVEIKELEKEYQEALERNRRAKEILNDLPDDDDEDI